jgi:hypothetical protein
MIELTPAELERIQQSLRKRFRIAFRPNVVDVGFGVARRHGRRDPRRPFSLVFFVKSKREKVSPKARIPRCVRVRIKRHGQFHSLELPTDIVPYRPLTRSGLEIRARNSDATVGVVVRWKQGALATYRWGILTAAHPFPRITAATAPADRVFTIRGPSPPMTAYLLFRSDLDAGADWALLSVTRSQLLDNGFMTESQASRTISPRTLMQLGLDRGKEGKSHRVGRARNLRIESYWPDYNDPDLGRMLRVIMARGDADVFEGGTSGSGWTISDGMRAVPAAIQVAGDEPDFMLGVGHALTSVLAWAESALFKQGGLVAGSFQLVAVR